MLRKVRSFFERREFLEVETPLLSADTVIDRHLDPIPITLFDDPRNPEGGRRMWLQTSPEFGMKRLLAAGAERVYQVTKAFRGGEQGALHNPEFTIVEWYRVGDSMQEGMGLLAELTKELLVVDTVGLVSYGEVFQKHVGLNPHVASVSELVVAATKHGISIPENMPKDDRDDWLNLLLATQIEPHLGSEFPQILYDYPASQAALAQIRDDDPPVAERFELYVEGIELANGYHELLDAETLRARNKETNEKRSADGKYTLPEESRLLEAMEHGLPPCVGVALGFDRLVMVAAGAKSLREVMAFPCDRA
jgi:lysyl-tRNA synthetase class 2